MMNGSEKLSQPNPVPEVPEQPNPWQDSIRTAEQDREAGIIENENEDYKRTRTQEYLQSEQGSAEQYMEDAFDEMAKSIDAMVAEGKISGEVRDELLEKQMNIVIKAIDELRDDYEISKEEEPEPETDDQREPEAPADRAELGSRLAKDFELIRQAKAAQEKEEPAPANEDEITIEATEEQSVPQADIQNPIPAPESAQTTADTIENASENSQDDTTEDNVEPAPQPTPEPIPMERIFNGPEMEELQQQKREEILEQHVSDLVRDNARELIGKDGELENKKIAKKVVSEEKDKLNAQIAAIEQELAERGWQEESAQPVAVDTVPESEPSSAENSLEQLRNYIIENKIGGAWGSSILLDTAPMSDTVRTRNSAWWRELSQSEREEVVKYLKDTEEIAHLPYGKGVRDWLAENGWLADNQPLAAAA